MVPCLARLSGSQFGPTRTSALRRGPLGTVPGQCDERADHGDDDQDQGNAGDEAHEGGRA